MGEYGLYNGKRIKLGTCEDMYYLRADQRHLIRAESGNVNPSSTVDQMSIRFRFPWPDEDHVEPGAFDPYERAIAVPDGGVLKVPDGVEHYSVQFVARQGYLLSLPCPESQTLLAGADGAPVNIRAHIKRNGFAGPVKIVQQAFRNGNLALICQCGGCGSLYNLPTFADAEPVIVACRAEADRQIKRGESGSWWHSVADRITVGYAEAAVVTP